MNYRRVLACSAGAILLAVLVKTEGAEPIQQVKNDDTCYSGIDLVQLQDATSSFDNVWTSMARQVPSMLQALQATHPDSRYSLVVFGDKPVQPLGYSHDFCINELLPLGKIDVDKTVETVLQIKDITTGGGNDWPESQFEALYRTAISPTLGWTDDRTWGEGIHKRVSRSIPEDNNNNNNKETSDTSQRFLKSISEEGPKLLEPAVRGRSKVIMLVTDSISHLEGDVQKIAKKILPDFELTPEAMVAEGPNYKCGTMEYPPTKLVIDELRRRNIHLFVLASQGGRFDPELDRFEPSLEIARISARYWNENNTQLWYQDIFTSNEVSVFVAHLDPECNSYASSVQKLLENFTRWRCGLDATTTTTATSTTTNITTTTTITTTSSETTNQENESQMDTIATTRPLSSTNTQQNEAVGSITDCTCTHPAKPCTCFEDINSCDCPEINGDSIECDKCTSAGCALHIMARISVSAHAGKLSTSNCCKQLEPARNADPSSTRLLEGSTKNSESFLSRLPTGLI